MSEMMYGDMPAREMYGRSFFDPESGLYEQVVSEREEHHLNDWNSHAMGFYRDLLQPGTRVVLVTPTWVRGVQVPPGSFGRVRRAVDGLGFLEVRWDRPRRTGLVRPEFLWSLSWAMII